MAALFADVPQAIANTRLIADMTDLELPLGKTRLPDFPVPDGHTVETWLRTECERGPARALRRRSPTELQKRLDYELGVITSMGYAGVLPDRGRLRPLRPRAEHRHDLPRIGAGIDRDLHAGHHAGRSDPLRAAVRALPQPRPRHDAGHRRRLRGCSSRRGHRLRRAQVRQRPRRPDHHLRHDARAGRDPRRRPRRWAWATARSTASPRPFPTSSASSSRRR